MARLRAVVDTSSLVRAALNADSAAIHPTVGTGSSTPIYFVLAGTAFFVVPEQRVEVCRDPADNMVLEAALAVGSDVIVVSDDRDLLVDPWRGICIVKPEAPLAMYEANQPVDRTRGTQP